jgi:hypothetical protein
MESCLQNYEVLAVDEVNQPVFFADPPWPSLYLEPNEMLAIAREGMALGCKEAGLLTHLNPDRHGLARLPAPQPGRPVHGHDA